jgi:hypothetical protein
MIGIFHLKISAALWDNAAFAVIANLTYQGILHSMCSV